MLFCPSCDAYLNESDLIKFRIKMWENVDIEYDARCPVCNVPIGRMSWGKLEVLPELRERYEARLAREAEAAAAAASDAAEKEPEEAPFFDPPLPPEPRWEQEEGAEDWKQDEPYDAYTPPGSYRPDQMSGHYCPHCGKDLPNDVNLLPRRFGY